MINNDVTSTYFFKKDNSYVTTMCTYITMHTCAMRVACISPQAPKQAPLYEPQDSAADKSVNNISADGASAGGFESIKSAIDRHFSEHPSGLRNVVSAIIIVNLIDKRDDLKGACLFDTGANASIENDITAFVSYLEKV